MHDLTGKPANLVQTRDLTRGHDIITQKGPFLLKIEVSPQKNAPLHVQTLRAFATNRLLILPITRIQSNGVCRLTLVNIL